MAVGNWRYSFVPKGRARKTFKLKAHLGPDNATRYEELSALKAAHHAMKADGFRIAA